MKSRIFCGIWKPYNVQNSVGTYEPGSKFGIYENILKHTETVFPQNINELHGIAAGSKVSFCRKNFLSSWEVQKFCCFGTT